MEGRIRGVFEPRFDEDAVVWLQHEVFSNVVYNYTFVEGPAYFTQVFHEDHASGRGMLSVQAVGDAFLLVDLVEDPVSVVLHGGCEDDHLVDLTHFLKELIAAGSNPERTFTADFIIMDQGLIQVQH